MTPFRSDLSIDHAALEVHCRWLLDWQCDLAIFGTNSEANSLSVDEKVETIDRLVAGGIGPASLLPGTGACALPDAIRLTRHAVEAGVAGVLMLPPFFYKSVTDDGLFDFYARVIDAVADPELRLYLYHIPQVSQVPITLSFVERLLAAYPGVVAGIKDSAGDPDHTRQLVERFPGFRVLAGSEVYLSAAMDWGAAGCISATCNVNPAGIVQIASVSADPALQARCNAVRQTLAGYGMIPALKATLAKHWENPSWRNVRPPLVGLDDDAVERLSRDLDAIRFAVGA